MIQHFQFRVYPKRIESKDLKSYLNNPLFKIAKKQKHWKRPLSYEWKKWNVAHTYN